MAGFTLQCTPKGQQNNLQFNPNSSIDAPLHKFRWLHVPGSVHQGIKPITGEYAYTVTPRYFDVKKSLQPLDPALSVTVKVNVERFKKQGLELGFTRGFTQSQAFVYHFGLKALIRPKGKELLFDTKQQSGANATGDKYQRRRSYYPASFVIQSIRLSRVSGERSGS